MRHTLDPQSAFPRSFPGWVRVPMLDGRRLEARQEANRGGPEAPLAPDEMIAKFRDNAGRALSPTRASALESAVLELEKAPDLRPLLSLCRLD